MRMPGFTADVSLGAAGGHYNTPRVFGGSRDMVTPQLDALTFFAPYALSYGLGYAAGDTSFGYTNQQAAADANNCSLDCNSTLRSAARNCRRLPVADREECLDSVWNFYESCNAECRTRFGPFPD